MNKLSEIITEGSTTIEDHSKHGKELEKINVNNEIRILIDSLRDMEYDVIKHVQNLKKVTSEKERYETELKYRIQDQLGRGDCPLSRRKALPSFIRR